jgi:hypothetical protein
MGVRIALESDEAQPRGKLAGVGILVVDVVVAAPQQPDSAMLFQRCQPDVGVDVHDGIAGHRSVIP